MELDHPFGSIFKDYHLRFPSEGQVIVYTYTLQHMALAIT